MILDRAMPEDLALAESLMAAEYKQFVQGQTAELQSILPSKPPKPFRATRYFSTFQIAVWQREEKEQMEHVITNIPVHPQDGSVDPAEEQQRRRWIQKLTQEQIEEVDTLLRHKWQMQRTAAPAWMRGIMPAEPLAEFWSAEYYACMAELDDKSRKQKEVEPVHSAIGRNAAEPMLLRPGISEVQRGSS